MLSFLPGPVKGAIILILVILNTLLWMPILVVGALLKIIIPINIVKKIVTKTLIACATNWVSMNNFFMAMFLKVEWDFTSVEGLTKNDWYFVNCNHQSWSDIPITQKILNRKIPMLKFFLKKELIWVPIIGICWWALDFPFMKRSTPAQIKKDPSLAGKDLETTQKACEKFKTTPVSVFNFLEGTRFTPEKHARQESPFTNLLKPKAGGAAFVLGSMGSQMNTMLDLTIVYHDKDIGPWDLFCGRISKVTVHINKIEIPKEFLGKDYSSDPEFKAAFQAWLNTLWENKDQLITDIKTRNNIN
ncbi:MULTISPECIES: acyltransferase [unclassified Oleiphilus]|jgi:1-acyl-sn-glycerol-3-phosphate acyltransferase|nr:MULTISPECIES: acyltransferase [unclassified Oleiphilus]KZY46759.1 acyltransferase [Oleiphilus sp. HI0050]KZY83342.1 acyltransferase [Oleiphilus sp. HI0069]KZY84733.1 acyltransferase [Oleiphilus sp. HI0068]KZY89027.1 acyltransferase [Oleiphilus sp. HI0072]KZZ15700.1 acyltransferase [Oleiphilus sp. HI0078]KZZ21704.1 acyltransferase [Oleiphilus sp. HI0081]KZZ32490.1 acyltransferase [Oleiphilus sp. HI0085]